MTTPSVPNPPGSCAICAYSRTFIDPSGQNQLRCQFNTPDQWPGANVRPTDWCGQFRSAVVTGDSCISCGHIVASPNQPTGFSCQRQAPPLWTPVLATDWCGQFSISAAGQINTYTPNVAANTGTFGAVVCTGEWVALANGVVEYTVQLNIQAVGTAGGQFLTISLPTPPVTGVLSLLAPGSCVAFLSGGATEYLIPCYVHPGFVPPAIVLNLAQGAPTIFATNNFFCLRGTYDRAGY